MHQILKSGRPGSTPLTCSSRLIRNSCLAEPKHRRRQCVTPTIPRSPQDLFALILLAMADEEPVDQKRYYEDSCKPKCVKPLIDYQACVKRIEGDDSGHKHCTGQYFDYWSCVDKCAATKTFSKLK